MNPIAVLLGSALALSACGSPPPEPQSQDHARTAVKQCPADLPHRVPVDFGEADFLPGDAAMLSDLCGSAARFEVGGRYQLRGRYTLVSRDRASLVVAVTENNATKRTTARAPASTPLISGTHEFVLRLTLTYEGYPHLRLYGAEGKRLGGFYFGTEQWLLPHEDKSHTPGPDSSTPDPRSQRFELL